MEACFTENCSPGEPGYLLQLLLHRPLLLADVTKLGSIFLGEGSARPLGRSLLGRQRFLSLPVGGDLFLQEALLHLQELLRLSEPLLVLTPLRLVWKNTSHIELDSSRTTAGPLTKH